MKRVLLIVLWLKFLLVTYNYAQIPGFKFKPLPSHNKLSNHSVTCMAQDSMGFIWIGTADGLNRYNGYEFDIYRNRVNNPVGLTSNEISQVFVDSNNRVWVITQFGISYFNSSKDIFVPVVSNEEMRGINNLFITAIGQDKKGSIIVTAGNSIFYLNEKKWNFELLAQSDDGLITNFVFGPENDFWLGHDNGKISHYLSNGKKNPDFAGSALCKILEMKTGEVTGLVINENYLWVGYHGFGVVKYNFDTKEIKEYLDGSYERFVVSLYPDNEKCIWITDYTGIKKYNKANDDFYRFYHNVTEANSIRPNVEGVFLDKQGNYYFYYKGEGIFVSYANRGFRQFDTSSQYYWHVLSANIMAISEDKRGNLWMGGFNGGIDVFDWISGKIIRYPNNENDKARLGIGTIFKIYCSNDGLMWVGSHIGGLRSFDRNSGKLNIYQHIPGNNESLRGNDVRSFCEDANGNFWVGVHGMGISYFDVKKGSFKHFTHEKNKLSSDWVESVLLDSNGQLWVGTTNGLNILPPGDSIFQNFLPEGNNPGAIQGNRILCIYESKNNDIWVGTNDGLYVANNNGGFTRCSIKASSEYICSIEEDHHGKIWFSTIAGLFRLNPKNFDLIHYSENDGLQGNGFNPRASFNNGKTELFFAGTKGVNLFNPDDLLFNKTHPKIVFSRFLLFNKAVEKYGAGEILENHMIDTENITLKYNQNVFTIGFTALNLTNPERNEYAYIMDGFDKEWNYVGNKREATYTNLDPGIYNFRVKAANIDGVWSNDPIELKIRVLPPWYRTNLFYILLIVTIIIIPYAFFRLRTENLRRQKKKLMQKVTEKTRILRKNNDTLKQRTIELNRINLILEERKKFIEKQSNELELQAVNLEQRNNELRKLNNTKNRLFSIIAHDLRAPFNTILGFSNLLVETEDYDNIELVASHARYIHDASLQVFNLLENLFYWARSQTNEIHCKLVASDLDQIVNENLSLIKESLIKKGQTINLANYANYKVFIDIDMMRTVIRNLLINAIKFTPNGGSISVFSERVGKMVKLSVTDTGIGIGKEEIELLTIQGEQKTSKGTNGERGSGLGLILCNEFVLRNKGRLVIESEVGKGSTFSILIPSG